MPTVFAQTRQAIFPILAADGAAVAVAASASDVSATTSAVAGTISLLACGIIIIGPTMLLAHQERSADVDTLTGPPIKPKELTNSSVTQISCAAVLLWATACSISVLALGTASFPECSSSQDQFYVWSLVYLSLVGPTLRIRASLSARSAFKSIEIANDGAVYRDLKVVVAGYSTCTYFEKAKGHADRLVAAGQHQLLVEEFATRDEFQSFLAQWKQTAGAKAIGAAAQRHRTCPVVWLAPAGGAQVDNPLGSKSVDDVSMSGGALVAAFVGGCDDLGRLVDEKCGPAHANKTGWAIRRVVLALCASLLVCIVSYAATSQAVTGYMFWWPPATLTAEPPAVSLITWEHDWQTAVATAVEEQKPLFIDFFARWCGPCRHMDFSTLAAPEVVAMTNSNFVPLKQDCSESHSAAAELKHRWNIRAMPAYAFITARQLKSKAAEQLHPELVLSYQQSTQQMLDAMDAALTLETTGQAEDDLLGSPGGAFAHAIEQGLLLTCAKCYLWGLVASATPCVFPMIPTTIALFSMGANGSAQPTKLQVAFKAAVYALGIALVHAVLGVVVTVVF